MPLVTAPFFALNSQYRPNRFVMSMTSASPLVLAQASVVIDLVGVTSISKSPIYNIGNTYYFEFDVSKALQTYSAPKSNAKTSVFPDTLNVGFNTLNTDLHTRVGLIVSYYYDSPINGLLTQFGATDIIPIDYPAIAGTRQTRDWNNMGMEDYIIDYPITGGVYERYFLTKLRSVYPTASSKTNDPIPICIDENLSMTYVPSISTNAIRVVVYDENQNTIGTAGFIQVTPNSTLTPITIGAGVEQLLNTIMTPSNPMTLIQKGYHYSIQAGNLTLPNIFILQGVKYMFEIVECCTDRSIRLHWLNRLGGADAYTFKSKKTIKQKIKSELAQKPQTWNYTLPAASIYDRGLFKIAQDVSIQYEVESEFYTAVEGSWISELLSSPEVYMETTDGLIAVVITDSDITISENDELLNITINFVESNNISVQQN